MSAKILTLDLETAPMKSYHWGLWEQNIGLDMIGDDWTILAYTAKWLHKDRLIYNDTSYDDDVRNDLQLAVELRELLDEADIVVGHNAAAFDVKCANTRMIAWGLEPYSPIHVVDTKKTATSRFRFPSNKLEYLTSRLTNNKKLKHKKFPGFELWDECLKGNRAAWAEMEKYNKADVKATEELYKIMRPWMTNHPTVVPRALPKGKPADRLTNCPTCNSDKLQLRGDQVTKAGIVYDRYHCQGCGSWHRSEKRRKAAA